MVAFASRRLTSAELAAAYGVAASEGEVRAERAAGPLGSAGNQAMRELRALARAGVVGRLLDRAVAQILEQLVARTTYIVGSTLRREGQWAQSVLYGIWDDPEPSPLPGGFLLEGRGWWLLEARQSKTAKYTEIIKSTGWEERLERWSSKITKTDPIADVIASGIARHANLDTIAKRVQPYVQGYASSAMRIVRTEVARVHNELAEETFREHASQISGFQILSQLDARVRPAHAARHGRIYRKGVRRPVLPDAPNCRCYYAPVLKKEAEGFGEFSSRTFDTTTYDEWFSNQPDDVRIRIVGKSRWQAVKDKGIRKPKWADFSSLKNGELLSVETIKRFTKKQIRDRRKQR